MGRNRTGEVLCLRKGLVSGPTAELWPGREAQYRATQSCSLYLPTRAAAQGAVVAMEPSTHWRGSAGMGVTDSCFFSLLLFFF